MVGTLRKFGKNKWTKKKDKKIAAKWAEEVSVG